MVQVEEDVKVMTGKCGQNKEKTAVGEGCEIKKEEDVVKAIKRESKKRIPEINREKKTM